MRTAIFLLAAACALSPLAHAKRMMPPMQQQPNLSAEQRNAIGQAANIEVVFVLDTTGSMSALIEGAKQKIWKIASELQQTKGRANIRMGLIAYRDRGDDYITQRYDLSNDISKIYSQLTDFEADGGGDEPESVNQALFEAVHKMSWSKNPNTLKIIFLVGDAVPHMDYKQDVPYPKTVRMAVKHDIIINTVLAGDAANTREVWQEMVKYSGGRFLAISAQQPVQYYSTPYDDRIEALNRDLNGTVIAYGSRTQQAEVKRKMAKAAPAKAAVAADMAKFNSKDASTKGEKAQVITGEGDLVKDYINKGDAVLANAEALPPELRGKSSEAVKATLKANAQEREKISAELDDLLKKRAADVQEQEKKQSKKQKADSFDTQVVEVIREQAERKGIAY